MRTDALGSSRVNGPVIPISSSDELLPDTSSALGQHCATRAVQQAVNNSEMYCRSIALTLPLNGGSSTASTGQLELNGVACPRMMGDPRGTKTGCRRCNTDERKLEKVAIALVE